MHLSRGALVAAMFSFSTLALAAESTGTDTSAAPPKTVTCKDGTTSTAGQGACSHHGGVKSTHSTSSSSSTKHNNATNPKGATAKCKDGTYSHSKNQSGACSKHGGVDTWMGSSSSSGSTN